MITAAIALMTAATALPRPVQGDFDHDGKTDIARIVGTAKSGYSLIVERGANSRQPETVFQTRQLRGLFLDSARPGVYRTACDKKIGPDKVPCPIHHVRLDKRSLVFGYEEASSATIVWRRSRFVVVWLTD